SELARLHAPVFADQALAEREWLNQPSPVSQALVAQLLPGFFERYGERVSEEHRALCERLVGSLDQWLADRQPPLGLVHGDFRLDNLLFGSATSPRPLTVVDWQTVGYGAAMADAAYFLGGGLRAQDRRSCEAALLEQYHEALSERGVRAEREACQEQFRRQTLGGVLIHGMHMRPRTAECRGHRLGRAAARGRGPARAGARVARQAPLPGAARALRRAAGG